jgi:hypothetical protein
MPVHVHVHERVTPVTPRNGVRSLKESSSTSHSLYNSFVVPAHILDSHHNTKQARFQSTKLTPSNLYRIDWIPFDNVPPLRVHSHGMADLTAVLQCAYCTRVHCHWHTSMEKDPIYSTSPALCKRVPHLDCISKCVGIHHLINHHLLILDLVGLTA